MKSASYSKSPEMQSPPFHVSTNTSHRHDPGVHTLGLPYHPRVLGLGPLFVTSVSPSELIQQLLPHGAPDAARSLFSH